MYDLNVYGNINTLTISSFYNNLYNIKSNNIETNLFNSPVATTDTSNNTCSSYD